jgi:hypothetical protein
MRRGFWLKDSLSASQNAFDHQPPRYDEERAGAGMMLCQ